MPDSMADVRPVNTYASFTNNRGNRPFQLSWEVSFPYQLADWRGDRRCTPACQPLITFAKLDVNLVKDGSRLAITSSSSPIPRPCRAH